MKRVALITGVGRKIGTESDPLEIETELRSLGVRVVAIEADLADAATPASLMEQATGALGPVTALVLSHSESVDSSILTTTLESFDRLFAVNTRAAWLLVAEFARQLLDADIRTALLAQQPTGRFAHRKLPSTSWRFCCPTKLAGSAGNSSRATAAIRSEFAARMSTARARTQYRKDSIPRHPSS